MDYETLADGTAKCNKCQKIYSIKGIGTHLWRAHGAGKEFKANNQNRVAWNKGKSLSEEHKKKLSVAKLGRDNLTEAGRKRVAERMTQTMSALYESGWSGPTWCKKYSYSSVIAGDITVDGTWELKYCKHLDANNIKWRRNTKRFAYIDSNGKHRTYCPDFFLIDENLFIEIKGRTTIDDPLKWASVKNLKVFFKEDLELLGIL